MKPKFPAAMPPPTTALTYLTQKIVAEAELLSKESPRKRIIYPIHKSDDANTHRMFNVMQPETYIVPHCHISDRKTESVIVLKGSICFFSFDERGNITSKQHIKAGGEVFGVDIEPHVLHTFVVLEENTVIFEVKPGPYTQSSDKDFVNWAPKEGTEEAKIYLKNLQQLTHN
ncbi:WbuC family cupin fold metalloprotein [Zhouia sp. PK063]|uniref:WbuC family cupin fold metalloprotein n=1 Tax=Zhouia sp. PK063 TaxID=3373602 RepID=UPI0037BB715D